MNWSSPYTYAPPEMMELGRSESDALRVDLLDPCYYDYGYGNGTWKPCTVTVSVFVTPRWDSSSETYGSFVLLGNPDTGNQMAVWDLQSDNLNQAIEEAEELLAGGDLVRLSGVTASRRFDWQPVQDAWAGEVMEAYTDNGDILQVHYIPVGRDWGWEIFSDDDDSYGYAGVAATEEEAMDAAEQAWLNPAPTGD